MSGAQKLMLAKRTWLQMHTKKNIQTLRAFRRARICIQVEKVISNLHDSFIMFID